MIYRESTNKQSLDDYQNQFVALFISVSLIGVKLYVSFIVHFNFILPRSCWGS